MRRIRRRAPLFTLSPRPPPQQPQSTKVGHGKMRDASLPPPRSSPCNPQAGLSLRLNRGQALRFSGALLEGVDTEARVARARDRAKEYAAVALSTRTMPHV